MSNSNTEKIIQAVVNGLASLRMEMMSGFKEVNKRIDGVEFSLTKKIDGVEERLTKRIDKIGSQLAYLEDDAPTREEFDKRSLRAYALNLEKKVDRHILEPAHSV